MGQEAVFNTGWILAAIGTVVSTLAGLVAMFYRQQMIDYRTDREVTRLLVEKLEVRADQCEADRESLRIKYAVLESRVTYLEEIRKNKDTV